MYSNNNVCYQKFINPGFYHNPGKRYGNTWLKLSCIPSLHCINYAALGKK